MESKKPEPLKSRTRTLNRLQLDTLDVLRKVKFQLRKAFYEEGMSDEEFISRVLEPFMDEIYTDRQIEKMARSKND